MMLLEPAVRKCTLCVVVAVLAIGPIRADELRTLAGKSIAGKLRSVTEKEITLFAKDGPATTPFAQVLALDLHPIKAIPTGTKYIDVRLIDDTLLHCRELKFQGGHADLTLTSGIAFKLPLTAISYFMRDADNAAVRKKFEEYANKKVRSDRIVILDAKSGVLQPLEGVLGGEVDAEGKIAFKNEGAPEARPIPLDRLHGLIFFRPDAPADSPICKVFDREGNMLTALKIQFGDDGWKLTTVFGATLSLPPGAVAKLDLNMGKLTYLSEMEPARVVERSSIGLVVRYRKDANLDGEAILLNQRYEKGLSMHAHTELEYNLAGKFKDLKGILGVDSRTGADSQPLVTIYCDGEKRFSETITAKETRPISLNVKDVTVLKIVVSSRNELDLHDHASFAEARVSQ